MFENKERTEINHLGEFGLIQHLMQSSAMSRKENLLGYGDDCSVYDAGDHFVLLSSELFLEGVHFDLTFHPLKHLGYKMVVAAISDVLAMNGTPSQLQIGVALSNRFSLEAMEELYAGIFLACKEFQVDLTGGDTSTSPRGLAISTTVIGKVLKENITYRKGASPNDLLVVTGDVGGAYMGLQILEREKRIFLENPQMQPDLESKSYIVGRQLRPNARLDVIEVLKNLEILPTSMIDVSDGIASELMHLSKASGVHFVVHEDKLPIDPQTLDTALGFNLNPSIVALNGGEDFELLMTIPQKDFEKIKGHPDLTIIGYAEEGIGNNKLITRNGNEFDIRAQGWPETHS